MSVNKTAAPCAITEAAREIPDPNANLDRKSSQRNSTPRPRGPGPWRSLSELVDDGLLSTFLDLGSRP
jgi:hypothetical protein